LLDGGSWRISVANRLLRFDTIFRRPQLETDRRKKYGEPPLVEAVGIAFIAGMLLRPSAHTALLVPNRTIVDGSRGPYAGIAIMRALDGHSVEWEEGYIRHLE
jgi:hypothetical protein